MGKFVVHHAIQFEVIVTVLTYDADHPQIWIAIGRIGHESIGSGQINGYRTGSQFRRKTIIESQEDVSVFIRSQCSSACSWGAVLCNEISSPGDGQHTRRQAGIYRFGIGVIITSHKSGSQDGQKHQK